MSCEQNSKTLGSDHGSDCFNQQIGSSEILNVRHGLEPFWFGNSGTFRHRKREKCGKPLALHAF